MQLMSSAGFLQNGLRDSHVWIPFLQATYRFGVSVANAILDSLEVKPNEPGADQGHYRPKLGRFRFYDEPKNPVKLMPVNPNQPNVLRAVREYHAPYYGITATWLAVHDNHIVADPPVKPGKYSTGKRFRWDIEKSTIPLAKPAPNGASELLAALGDSGGAFYWLATSMHSVDALNGSLNGRHGSQSMGSARQLLANITDS
ncbi:hypothetical protein IFM61606_08930 [Aspergillus udagawae]|nr:hypothetical protein IFM61606_08930 [Aspergillus udagawae]